MLNTESFLAGLRQRGYSHICAVPCSYASNLINAAIADPDIKYLPAASEAVACSVAAGLRMSGASPIVIAQSSGLTNMGSCITSLLKPYGICFPMIVSWRSYQAGDSEVQHQHLANALPALVEAYGYDWQVLDNTDTATAIDQVACGAQQPTITLLMPDTFSPVELPAAYRLDLGTYPRRSQFLELLNEAYAGRDTVFVGTTGHTSREMYRFMPATRNFYMAGNMGGALSVGYGAYLAGNHVIVCGGDAESVMHLGGMVTANQLRNDQGGLVYILFDNESNKSTGGQSTGNLHVDYQSLAGACGFRVIDPTISDTGTFMTALRQAEADTTPAFLHVKCSYDDETPRASAGVIVDSQHAFLPGAVNPPGQDG